MSWVATNTSAAIARKLVAKARSDFIEGVAVQLRFVKRNQRTNWLGILLFSPADRLAWMPILEPYRIEDIRSCGQLSVPSRSTILSMARREVEEWFWQVGSDLQRLSDEMQRIRPALASGNAWEPRVDVIEDERRIIIKAEIAGVRGDDIQLLYIPENQSVLIRGLRREEDYEDGERTNFYQLEIFYGPFQREVRLPDVAICPDEIRASYRNGFLLVQIPKQERISVHTVTIKKI